MDTPVPAERVSSRRKWIKRHPLLINALLVLVSTAAALWVCEHAFRLFLSRAQPTYAAEMRTFCNRVGTDISTRNVAPHPYMSYARTDTVLEKDGIRIGSVLYPREKAPGTVRIACLGGSTTMGQYPKLLNAYLNQLPGETPFEVMDFGCQGWDLMESMINYFIRVSSFRPDLVFLHIGVNDGTAVVWKEFLPDHAHFRQSWQGREVGRLERFLLARSWLLVQFLRQQGQSALDLPNLVQTRVKTTERLPKPDPLGLDVFAANIRKTIQMVHAQGAQVILAPEPYNRTTGGPRDHAMIDQCNAVIRRVAEEMEIPLAETDVLLKDFPEGFSDLVHVKNNGQYVKVQLFSQVIRQVLQRGEKEAAHNPLTPSWAEGRDVELQWEYASEEAADFHIYANRNQEKEWRFVGRTADPHAKSFRWKYKQPALSPVLVKEFREGPQYGTHYNFQVFPIDKTTHKALTRLAPPGRLSVSERIAESGS